MTSFRPNELVTPPVRLAFPALFEPRETLGNGKLTYQAVLLLPPDCDLGPFKTAIAHVIGEKWGEKRPKFGDRSNPLKSCADKTELEGYEADWHYVNTRSNYAPTVVDQRLQPIIDADKVYAGCWVRAHIHAFAWQHPTGGNGVSFSLNNVQLVKDGDRLDGRKKVDAVFEPIAFESSDSEGVSEASEADLQSLFG